MTISINLPTEPPAHIHAEMLQWKRSLPFRIVYAAFDPSTGEWFCSAVTSMRIPNKLKRDGQLVWIGIK